ncbi:MAG: hypothetical protein Q9163_002328 [Psora crenata]
MGRPPAVIILARHGARLDAADLQWHLTSPTPYDPPLTYGGWKQSQALGTRIASLLAFRQDSSGELHTNCNGLEYDGSTPQHSPKGKRRKHKVFIHSSPYLRCVQTAIAISAGMEQWKGKCEVEDGHSHAKSHLLHSASPHIRSKGHWNSPSLSTIREPDEIRSRSQNPTLKKDRKVKADRTILRLDAFLGEWLSPDYYEDITPPPGSKMMIAGAKADLLRHDDPIDTLESANSLNKNQGSFPGGWNSTRLPPDQRNESASNAFPDIGELSQALPKLGRANSHDAISGTRPNFPLLSSVEDELNSEILGYVPPRPSYAISPIQPIPQGYVAHARDACIRVDYQWDSMRPPLEWGSGGEYGEEWSAMHRRFRRGLHELILWYRDHEKSGEIEERMDGLEETSHSRTWPSDLTDDDDPDTVLVLVTHGAGCNALIGALTNQPVLIDVGMASLTMAVRKTVDYKRLPLSEPLSTSPMPQRLRSSIDAGVSETYDVKLTASTDHLRPVSDAQRATPPRLRSPSLPVRDKSPYRYERHVSHTAHHHTNSPVRNPFTASPKAARGSEGSFGEEPFPTVHRASTDIGFSGGLWSPPSRHARSSTPDAARQTVLPLTGMPVVENPTPKSLHIDPAPANARTTTADQNGNIDENGTTLTQQGLWGAEPKALGAERDHTALKRRWTLAEV